MRAEAKRLFDWFVRQVGSPGPVLKYIDSAQEIAPSVTQNWLEGRVGISQGLQKKILTCLQEARLEDFATKQTIASDAKSTQQSTRIKSRRKDNFRTCKEERIRTNVEHLRRLGIIDPKHIIS